MASVEKLAGINEGPDMRIEVMSTNFRSAPDGITAQDMKLVVPAMGEVSGSGSISPAHALDFKMSAIVHASGLLAVIGDKPIPFTVTGTSSEPVFKPDVAAVIKEGINGIKKDASGLLKGLMGGKKNE
jgi:AsmA protein